jgi:alanine racemase
VSEHLRELVVDLDAISANTAVLVDRSSSGHVMAVVKADAYGHGLVPSARAALQGGASWLGVALLDEALQLRSAGVRAQILAWLLGPGERWADALNEDVDLSVSAPWVLEEITEAAREVGSVARIHLKVDSGLGRSGAPVSDWPLLVDAARKAELDGTARVIGVWSHLA